MIEIPIYFEYIKLYKCQFCGIDHLWYIIWYQGIYLCEDCYEWIKDTENGKKA